ncbi:sugar phosphate isomerase/epimerase [Magnetospirillum sp. UT-4]|uniref:sugar phosphate isomerase/epimerase family protein n=1 Tax=Magnetospirillum sp. UT-4 TaxID=2681467 RepID=UPI0013801753|nr:sugar phosphate isomerase/epimerase family protein [Magnetospirillum sp. UT-4]CAA7621831.1 Nitrogen-fixing NifU, C-terminal [Magnetospirillum sp. UT-4]
MDSIAISNIALPPGDHAELLPEIAAMGVTGLEVAPSRVWSDTWGGLTAAAVETYRSQVEAAGLQVIGLHSLFFDHPGLGLFKGEEAFEATIAFLSHLSAVCRDLGGRTLIYGGGRRRGEMAPTEAAAECDRFLARMLPVMAAHGTKLCFEPLGPKDTDFLNTAAECLDLARTWNHPGLGLQLDAKALVENGETANDTFRAVAGSLDHFHANEPGLAVIGSSGTVPHGDFAAALGAIGYAGWVSVEQRMFAQPDWRHDAAASIAAARRFYGS